MRYLHPSTLYRKITLRATDIGTWRTGKHLWVLFWRKWWVRRRNSHIIKKSLAPIIFARSVVTWLLSFPIKSVEASFFGPVAAFPLGGLPSETLALSLIRRLCSKINSVRRASVRTRALVTRKIYHSNEKLAISGPRKSHRIQNQGRIFALIPSVSR